MRKHLTGIGVAALICCATANPVAAEVVGPPPNGSRTLTLAEAQASAVQNNPSLKNVDELVYQADTMIFSAWSMLLPRLSATGSVTRNQREIALEFPDFAAFDPTDPAAPLPTSRTVIQERWGQRFGLTANMTLFNPRSVPLIKNAHDSADLARLQARRAKNDLLFAVTAAYYQVYSLTELVAVSEQNLTVAEELVRTSAARQQADLGTALDVTRAELQQLTARRELADAEDAVALARTALAHLTGIAGEFAVVGPERAVEPEGDLARLTDRALTDRVEVAAARTAEQIARRAKTESALRWLPAFDVTYDWSWASAAGFGGEHDQWALIFGASWSLFEGGGRIAELKARESQIRVARNDVEQQQLDIRREVEQAFLEVSKHRRNVELAEQQQALAAQSQQLVSKQYAVGMATSLDAIDAATALHNQQTAQVIERLQYDLAVLALGKAVGDYHDLAIVPPR